MQEQSACQHEKPWSSLPHGSRDVDNEAGTEQPHVSSPVMPLINTESSFHDLLRGLIEDVRALQRSTTDFRRRDTEIEQLRTELNEMKLKVDMLATFSAENVQDSSWKRVVTGSTTASEGDPQSEVADIPLKENSGQAWCGSVKREANSSRAGESCEILDYCEEAERPWLVKFADGQISWITELDIEEFPSEESKNERDESDAAYREIASRQELVEKFPSQNSSAQRPSMASGMSSVGPSQKASRGLHRRLSSGHHSCSSAGTKSIIADASWFGISIETSEAGLPILNSAAHMLGAQDMIYRFSETMWDTMPFCGLGVLTCGDQLCVVFVALLNLGVQASFIGLVSSSMLDNVFADNDIVTTFEKWRVMYAHNPDFADVFTNEPLAVSLCARSLFMMHGSSQASLYNDMADYTKPFLSIPAGAVMCLLSVLLWILTCAKEFNRIRLFLFGIWTSNDVSQNIWRSSYKKSFVQILHRPVLWMYEEAAQKNYQIFLTPSRALSLTFLVVLPRVAILISLGIVGVFFLAQTLQLTDLILNAVALDVVMNVDELLFDLFSPIAVKRLVCKTMPLRVPRPKGFGKHVEHWCKLAVASICLTAVAWGLLTPMIKIMNDVKLVMCDGDREFLAVQLPFGPVVAAQPSASAVDRGTYKYRAIHQRTRLLGVPENQNFLYVEGGSYRLAGQFQVAQIQSWRDQSIKDVAELSETDPKGAQCLDNAYARSHDAKFAIMSGVGSIIGNESMQSCDDVVHLCYNDTSRAGKTARLICPRRCGLDPDLGMAARSGLFLDTTEDGIPFACRETFAKSLREISCVDPSLGELLNGSSWKRYADGFSAYWSSYFMEMSTINNTFNLSHFNFMRKFLWARMSTRGCSLFRNVVKFSPLGRPPMKVSFCDPTDTRLYGKRSIRPLCPVTCQCNTNVMQHYKWLKAVQPLHIVDESQCPIKCFDPR